jgi:hypothetical protein
LFLLWECVHALLPALAHPVPVLIILGQPGFGPWTLAELASLRLMSSPYRC